MVAHPARRPVARRVAGTAMAVGLLVSSAACGDGLPVAGRSAETGFRTGPDIATTIDSALFTVDCRFSHRAADDPIVHPEQPGASHVHDFFGAEDTDAHSTAEQLRRGSTSCDDREDTAAYWAPTVYLDGAPLEPSIVRVYYRAAVGADVKRVQVLPPDLELIAGDMDRAAGDWPPLDEVGWGCGGRPKRLRHTPPTNCTVAAPVTLRLVFPDCWDGDHARSADHRSHAARSTRGRCPPSHPVPILQVQLSIQYPLWQTTEGESPPDTAHLALASGRWEGSHGDLLNAWDPDRLRHQTELCIRTMANCTDG